MKDYINFVYQGYSKFNPIQENLTMFPEQCSGCSACQGTEIKKGKIQENFYEIDQNTGNIYMEKPNWIGGKTEPLSQAMSDYIFENVNVPIK